MNPEIQVLELSLRVMTERLDMLITACLDENGKAKPPSMKDIMQARGYLPQGYSNSFPQKERT